jgi:hypothetical protein
VIALIDHVCKGPTHPQDEGAQRLDDVLSAAIKRREQQCQQRADRQA